MAERGGTPAASPSVEHPMEKVSITKASPVLVKRDTFGNPAAHVGGTMACGLFGEGRFLRLAPADR